MPFTPNDNLPAVLSPAMRRLYGTMFISVFLMIVAGAAALPFYFESSSMLYKFGADKTLLRSGKILGLIAACLVFLQSVLSARFKFLDRIFALNNLMNVHRINGLVIAGCVLFHPVLIFLPEDMTTIPLSFRYWPEFVGVFLLLMLTGIVLVALLRSRLNLAFDHWRIMHQWAAATVFIALFVHVLFVSETFESGPPRSIVFAVIGFYVLVFARIRIKPLLIRKKPFTVTNTEPAARDAYRIRIAPETGKTPAYLPGQFGFISLRSGNISPEAHPFTIASSPLKSGYLEFVIRICGDWTQQIGKIKNQDQVVVDGPFGLFTHLRCPPNAEIILIAGGIGITPMLSMLRYMADSGDQRTITLVWSNRTRDHIVFPDEFASLEKRLKGLRVIHVITDDPKSSKKNKLLDQAELEKLLAGCSRKSCIFVCGPPQMMTDMIKALLRAGFSKKLIFSERFSL